MRSLSNISTGYEPGEQVKLPPISRLQLPYFKSISSQHNTAAMADDSERKTGSDTYHIPKLTEENYRSWAQQLRWILDEKELLDIVEGKEERPKQATDSTSEEYEKELALWNKKMKKARSTIGASVSTSVMTYIEGMDNPAKMWKELEERYNPKSQATLLQLVREFMMAKKEDSID